MGARKSRQVETRMLAEYMKDVYSAFPRISKQPLGRVSEALMAENGYKRALGITRAFRPEVDGVVILPNHLLLIEAKVWRIVDGLAKLPLYKSLVPFTPELAQYRHLEVIMELVVGWTNPNLEIMAQAAGVTVKVYSPAWLAEIVDGMHNYWTRDYRIAREQRQNMLESLGLD